MGGGASEGEQSARWPGFSAEVSCQASRHRSSSQQTIRLQEQATRRAVSELPGYSSHSNLSLGWNELEISGNKMGAGIRSGGRGGWERVESLGSLYHLTESCLPPRNRIIVDDLWFSHQEQHKVGFVQKNKMKTKCKWNIFVSLLKHNAI